MCFLDQVSLLVIRMSRNLNLWTISTFVHMCGTHHFLRSATNSFVLMMWKTRTGWLWFQSGDEMRWERLTRFLFSDLWINSISAGSLLVKCINAARNIFVQIHSFYLVDIGIRFGMKASVRIKAWMSSCGRFTMVMNFRGQQIWRDYPNPFVFEVKKDYVVKLVFSTIFILRLSKIDVWKFGGIVSTEESTFQWVTDLLLCFHSHLSSRSHFLLALCLQISVYLFYFLLPKL